VLPREHLSLQVHRDDGDVGGADVDAHQVVRLVVEGEKHRPPAAARHAVTLLLEEPQLEQVVDDGEHRGAREAQPPREVGLRNLHLGLHRAEHQRDVVEANAGGVGLLMRFHHVAVELQGSSFGRRTNIEGLAAVKEWREVHDEARREPG
jgi:hypothetical protein